MCLLPVSETANDPTEGSDFKVHFSSEVLLFFGTIPIPSAYSIELTWEQNRLVFLTVGEHSKGRGSNEDMSINSIYS